MKNNIYENLNEDDLEDFEEVDVEIDEDSFKVNQGVCPECNKKMEKYIANFTLLDGALTFHIIKFRCRNCKREYMDLNEAEKYDLYLSMRNTPMISISSMTKHVKSITV